MAVPVLTKTLRDHRGGIAGWAAGLAMLTVMDLAVFPTVQSQAGRMEEFLKAYPQALRAMFGLGSDFATGHGYLDAELFSFLGPLVVLAVGIGFGAGATATEEERGTADWLLSAPVSRGRVIIEKSAAVLAAVLLTSAVLTAALLIGSPAAGLGLGIGGVFAAGAALTLLGWAFAAVAIAAGAATGRRWAATGVAVALGFAGFLVTTLARMVPSLESWQWLSPFTWYASGDALLGRLHAGYLAALAVTTVAALGLAVVFFRRRDIRS